MKEPITKLEHLRLSFGGALVGVCSVSIIWPSDLTAQYLFAIIGFGVAYITLELT